MNPNLILLTEFGSCLYGTQVPNSDKDYRGIYLPNYSQILLGNAPKTYKYNTKKDNTTKNTDKDIDKEVYSLQKYFNLLLEGQTVSLDILFSPEHHHFHTTDIWKVIKAYKHLFLHSGTSSFAGYCKTQANKYGIKGSRIAAVRKVLEWLSDKNDKSILMEQIPDILPPCLAGDEFISIVMCKAPNGSEEPHLEVCNRKVPFHAKIKYTRDVFQRIFDEYGKRSLQAEKNEGCDWKALMHAVRVCEEAKELLLTGNITFPRPEKELLLKIRKKELPYKEVASIIENGLEELTKLQEYSILPKQPKTEEVYELLEDIYANVVFNEF